MSQEHVRMQVFTELTKAELTQFDGAQPPKAAAPYTLSAANATPFRELTASARPHAPPNAMPQQP